MKRKPTLRMKRLAKKLVENGSKTMARAMRESGYSPNTAKAPTKVTNSSTWNALMDEYFPPTLVAKIQGELLTNPHKEVLYKGRKVTLYDGDIQTRNIDTIHKLRGSYKATEVKLTGLEQYKDLPIEQLQKIANGTP